MEKRMLNFDEKQKTSFCIICGSLKPHPKADKTDRIRPFLRKATIVNWQAIDLG